MGPEHIELLSMHMDGVRNLGAATSLLRAPGFSETPLCSENVPVGHLSHTFLHQRRYAFTIACRWLQCIELLGATPWVLFGVPDIVVASKSQPRSGKKRRSTKQCGVAQKILQEP